MTALDFQKLKDRIYEKYGCGIARDLFESLRSMDTPTIDQDSFQFFNDGTEAGATQKADPNIDITNQALDVVFQVRFLVKETAGNAAGNQRPQLEYQVDGGGFVTVDGASSNVRAADGAVTDGEDCTQRIGSGTFVTDNNGVDEVNGRAGTMAFVGNDEAEYLYSILLRSAELSGGEAIDLRVADMDVYTIADASLTVASGGATTRTKNVDLDSRVLEIGRTKNVDLDARIQEQGIVKTVDLDARVLATLTKNVDLDARVFSPGLTKTVDLDARIQEQGLTRTVDLDALVLIQATRIVDLDARVLATLTKTVDLDARVLAQGLIKTVDLDALVLIQFTRTVDLDTLVFAPGLFKTLNLDARVFASGLSKTVGLDAVVTDAGGPSAFIPTVTII